MKRFLALGLIFAGGCATLPKHEVPDVLELRFDPSKTDRDKVFDAITEALYETGYPVVTYDREGGTLETIYKPYNYGCCAKFWAFWGLGVRDPSIRIRVYVGKAPDDRISVKLQGVLRFKGPRPLGDEYQERPVKQGTRYWAELEKIAKLLEEKLGQSGMITRYEAGLEPWW